MFLETIAYKIPVILDGIILTNTMKSKDGGISGTRDLYTRSNDILRLVYKTVEGKIYFLFQTKEWV